MAEPQPDQSQPTSRTFSREIVAALLGFGGYASLASILGYVYRWAYLEAFGASFLLGQVPTPEVLFGTGHVLMPLLVSFVAVSMGGVFTASERALARFVIVTLYLGASIYLVQSFFHARLLLVTRLSMCAIAASILAFTCAAVARHIVARWKRAATIWVSVVMFAAAGISYCLFAGRAAGLADAIRPDANMPSAVVRGQQAKLYVLFVTGERIYGVRTTPDIASYRIDTAEWSTVEEIRGKP